MLTLFRKEVAAFFNSLIAYLVMAVFLTGVGLFFWLFEFNVLETGYADMNALFDFGPYFFLLLVPAITMRSFSEEMKSGTLEFLFTKPVTDWQIILGKYLAAVFLVLFALLPTLVYFFTVYWLGDPVGNIDTGAVMGSYLGLFFWGPFLPPSACLPPPSRTIRLSRLSSGCFCVLCSSWPSIFWPGQGAEYR